MALEKFSNDFCSPQTDITHSFHLSVKPWKPISHTHLLRGWRKDYEKQQRNIYRLQGTLGQSLKNTALFASPVTHKLKIN